MNRKKPSRPDSKERRDSSETNAAKDIADTSAQNSRTQRIRELNDQLRTTGIGGRLLITRSVTERGRSFLMRAITAMRRFEAFGAANDPYGEHDFGGFEVDGETMFFKIDYYDNSLTAGTEDPADPTRCTRVLTLMCAADY